MKVKFYVVERLPKEFLDDREPSWSKNHVIWAHSAREASDRLRNAGVRDRIFSSYPNLYQVKHNRIIEYRFSWNGWYVIGGKELPIETRFYYAGHPSKSKDAWSQIYDLCHHRDSGWKLVKMEIENAQAVRMRRKSVTEYEHIPFPKKPEKPIVKIPVEWITGDYINMYGFAKFERKNVKGLIEVDEDLTTLFVNKRKDDVRQRPLKMLQEDKGFFSFTYGFGLDALTIEEFGLPDGKLWRATEGWVK